MNEKFNIDKERARILASPLLFTQFFYKIRTGRSFFLSNPVSRESHYITICRALRNVFDGNIKKLYIGIPPRYGKTELVMNFVAWSMANYPDSNFLYTSYSSGLAVKASSTIRDIISLPVYNELFNIQVSNRSSAKDDFKTIQGGSVYAVGAQGTVTGREGGILNSDRYGGAVIMDDMHKPDEATSDSIRNSVIEWYYNTLQSRANPPNTPTIFIGQRVHEDDLASHLIKSGGWNTLILPALDEHNNALNDNLHTKEELLEMKEKNPYVFSSQYQQNPTPAGGGVFKEDWFYLTDEEPEILCTFITADTAETSKNYNDATVFSFWGLYKIKNNNHETNEYGLHWIDCIEIRVEPYQLHHEFMQFYGQCSLYKEKPKFVAVEKKSTGVTLLSILKQMRGLFVLDIERTKVSGNKSDRFLEIQPYLTRQLISLPRYGKHTKMCIEHCGKITINGSHRFDDIADTMYDAINIGLIKKIAISYVQSVSSADKIVERLSSNLARINNIKGTASWHR